MGEHPGVAGFAITGLASENRSIDDSDWQLIEEFVRRIHLIKAGLAAKTFEDETMRELEAAVEREAIESIWKI